MNADTIAIASNETQARADVPPRSAATDKARPAMAVPVHMRALDGLRAVAVVGVMAFHWIPGRWSTYLPTGLIAVRIFFVLSGFLITGILLRARRAIDAGRATRWQQVRRFYVRRSLRILPVYYLVVFAMAALNTPDARRTLAWHVLYATNIWTASQCRWHDFFGHLWSLSVEQQFYLIWPLLILWLPKRWLPSLFWMALAGGPVLRCVTYALARNTITPRVLPTSCIDTLGAGALLAWWADQAGGKLTVPVPLRRPCLFAGLLLTGVALLWTGGGVACTLLDSGIALLGLLLVAALASRRLGVASSLFATRPLVYLGTISYGAYVYHGFAPAITRWGCQVLHVPMPGPWGAIPWRAGVTMALAAASWHLLERPLNDLKQKFGEA